MYDSTRKHGTQTEHGPKQQKSQNQRNQEQKNEKNYGMKLADLGPSLDRLGAATGPRNVVQAVTILQPIFWKTYK